MSEFFTGLGIALVILVLFYGDDIAEGIKNFLSNYHNRKK